MAIWDHLGGFTKFSRKIIEFMEFRMRHGGVPYLMWPIVATSSSSPRVVQAGYVASRNLDGRLDVDAIGKSMLLQRRAPLVICVVG
jgi:hypothetical protein